MTKYKLVYLDVFNDQDDMTDLVNQSIPPGYRINCLACQRARCILVLEPDR